jgi:hypothetical protein
MVAIFGFTFLEKPSQMRLSGSGWQNWAAHFDIYIAKESSIEM